MSGRPDKSPEYVWTSRQKSGHMSGRPDMKIASHQGRPLSI